MAYLIFQENEKTSFLKLIPGLSMKAGCTPDCNIPLPAEHCAHFMVSDDGDGCWTLFNLDDPAKRVFEKAALSTHMFLNIGPMRLFYREEFDESCAEALLPVCMYRFCSGQNVENFTIEKLLFESEHAGIYLVSRRDSDEKFCMKVYRPEQLFPADEAEFLDVTERIQKEAPPGIASVHGRGVFRHAFPWIVTDYCPDPNLEFRISAKAPMHPVEAAGIAATLAFILGNARTATGMFCGSLEPDRVLYKENRKLLLTDFGLFPWKSRTLCSGRPCVPAWYISPEQITGGEITWKTDQYSLGVMLFRMLTGMLPYHSDDPETLFGMHLYGPFPSPRDRNPSVEIPGKILEALRKMTARDPELRFSTWDELRKAL